MPVWRSDDIDWDITCTADHEKRFGRSCSKQDWDPWQINAVTKREEQQWQSNCNEQEIGTVGRFIHTKRQICADRACKL